MAPSKEKRKHQKLSPIADLLEKNFKAIVLKILKELKEDVGKVKKWCIKIKNINKEIENLKRNQKEILELKSTIIEMKNSQEGLKGIFEQVEESVNLKIGWWKLLSVRDRKKNIEKWTEPKGLVGTRTYMFWESQKEKREIKEQKESLKK